MNPEQRTRIDREHIWHPYSAMRSPLPVFPVSSASGVRLRLNDGRELIDGMASWWCVIHGYGHPRLKAAMAAQIDTLPHVMFGGLTHDPAVRLTEQLLDIVPRGLDKVFFCDSGSVSVEVAMKLAIQYWHAQGQPQRTRFVALRGGYHGDTFGAMSVCDPVTGMHGLFDGILPRQTFIERPRPRFGDACTGADMQALQTALEKNHDIAALILEPVVQGAGGMWFYAADWLRRARRLCDEAGVLLIADEIATGFGRTGELFACAHAGISPDILCIGKALTGGYLSLAATLTTAAVSDAIDAGEPGVFMHGPTFMANPLACATASASIELLLGHDWRNDIARIQAGLERGLIPCREMAGVRDVRVLGAIGVVEMLEPVDMRAITHAFVERGVWVRPFGRLVYLMPPYVIGDDDLDTLTRAIVEVTKNVTN